MANLLSLKRFFGRPQKRMLACLGMLIGLFVLLGAPLPALAAEGYVKIVNLTSKTLNVGATRFQPGVSKSGLTSVPNNYMVFNGWYTVEPGKAIDLPPGGFYVEADGNRITWPNRNQYDGLVAPGKIFRNVYIRSGTYTEVVSSIYFAELSTFLNANPGYKRVTYQSLGAGQWNVTSAAGSPQRYQVISHTFPYNYRTRDPHVYIDCYPVAGTVIDYEYSAESLNASSGRWTQKESSVCLSVRVEGYQRYPGAARTQGYYTGWVKVYYTVPY